jgi:hypothetical protein
MQHRFSLTWKSSTFYLEGRIKENNNNAAAAGREKKKKRHDVILDGFIDFLHVFGVPRHPSTIWL